MLTSENERNDPREEAINYLLPGRELLPLRDGDAVLERLQELERYARIVMMDPSIELLALRRDRRK